jgi:hypothetical protein
MTLRTLHRDTNISAQPRPGMENTIILVGEGRECLVNCTRPIVGAYPPYNGLPGEEIAFLARYPNHMW